MGAAFPPCSVLSRSPIWEALSAATLAFLTTEQLNWSNWGFSESSEGAPTVAAEGRENITHSFKPASP